MSEFLSGLSDFNASVNDVIWGAFGLVLLIGTGILMTVLTKCFQVTKIKLWGKRTIGRLFSKDTHKRGPNAISPFQAVCTAPAISWASPRRSSPAVPARFSGCGSRHSSE